MRIQFKAKGGFHNASEIAFYLSKHDTQQYINGWVSLRNCLSPKQKKRLDKHFCGIESCVCGGISRAEITQNLELGV
jgi:hypothetical protein